MGERERLASIFFKVEIEEGRNKREKEIVDRVATMIFLQREVSLD